MPATPEFDYISNIVDDWGAFGRADEIEEVTAVVSITAATPNLSSTTPLWAPEDAGKSIFVTGAGTIGQNLSTSIATVTDSQNIVLADNAFTTLSAVSTLMRWGYVDGPAFEAHRAYVASLGHVRTKLILPSGSYQFKLDLVDPYLFAEGQRAGWNAPFYGLRGSIFVQGDLGTEILNCTTSGALANITGSVSNDNQGFIATANAGDSSVTLLNPADASKFTVGRMALVAAMDMQGFGFPLNMWFHEYVRVLHISSGGVITFGSPLVNTYKSSYPTNDTSFGGAAAAYGLEPSWDFDLTFNGIRFLEPTTTSHHVCGARKIRFEYCAWEGCDPTPAGSQLYEIIGGASPDEYIEFDKMTTDYLMQDHQARGMHLQSSSNTNLRFVNSEFLFGVGFTGLGKNVVIERCKILGLTLGVSYGANETCIMRDCEVASAGASASGLSLANFTYDGSGTFEQIGNSDAVTWAVPGAKMFFYSPTNFILYNPFEILDVRQVPENDDATGETFVDTSLTGALPTVDGGVPTFVWQSPCPSFLVERCTGCDEIEEYSRHSEVYGATPISFGEYSFRTYLGLEGRDVNADSPAMVLIGTLVSVTVTVTRAYTGDAHPTLFLLFGGPSGYRAINGDDSVQFWKPAVDLKIAGARQWTPSGETGIQGTDVNPAVTPVWFGSANYGTRITVTDTGGGAVDLSTDDESEWPIVTVEWILDQGLDAL